MNVDIKKTIGGVLFLVLSIFYGYNASQIQLFSSVVEAFNARTLPLGLSAAGVIFSILLLVIPDKNPEIDFIDRIKKLNWRTTIQLFVAMSIYGLIFKPLGFFIATFLFLNACFWIMGERNIRMMLIISSVLIIAFWFLLRYLLDIYIDPGALFSSFLGGAEEELNQEN